MLALGKLAQLTWNEKVNKSTTVLTSVTICCSWLLTLIL